MAAKIVDNSPFDPRISTIPFPFLNAAPGFNNDKLTKGYVIQEKPVNNVRYKCSFLYNPSVLSVSHSVDGTVIANQDAVDPNDVSAGHLLLPLQQTASFSLLFDRTYELWDASKIGGPNVQTIQSLGAAWDVLSLYKITGIATPTTVTGSGTDAKGDSLAAFQKGMFQSGAAGPMLYTPVFLVIGSSLDYYGVIQQMDIQYTHWTQFMVPVRAQVDISMTLLPRTSNTGNPRPAGPSGNGIAGLPSGTSLPSTGVGPVLSGRGGR